MNEDLFYQGETFEEFLESLDELGEKYHQCLSESKIDDSQFPYLTKLPADTKVMVVAEPWSGDVLYYLPVLINMAEKVGWDVRIFRRDTYPDLILPYLKDGIYHSIPVFVFYDSNFNEIGYWIERPTDATRVIDEESLNLRRRLREEYKAEWSKHTIDEVMELFKL